MALVLTGYVPGRTKIKLGGKEFVFGELNMADLAEFRADIQKEKNKANEIRRQRLIEESKKIGNIDPVRLLELIEKPMTEDEFEDAMETTSGFSLLAYLSLRKYHQGISQEQVQSIVTPNKVEAITAAMFPKENGEQQKKTKKRKRRESPGRPR
jgi:hypothetical protein